MVGCCEIVRLFLPFFQVLSTYLYITQLGQSEDPMNLWKQTALGEDCGSSAGVFASRCCMYSAHVMYRLADSVLTTTMTMSERQRTGRTLTMRFARDRAYYAADRSDVCR